MNNKNTKTHSKRRNRKLLLLFIVFGISVVGMVYTTYAWFIGSGKVVINNFTINIDSENSLEISLDGYTWNENITITENTIKAHSAGGSAYAGNTNSWVGEHGLVPVSSSGDNTYGKLDIYSQTSLDADTLGYKLRANKIDNSETEKNHYVTFDIFVKNKSGDVYTRDYNINDDENIYLTSGSSVIGTANGATSYGVQNSARVAFVQVGRISIDDLVAGTTPVIKCENPTDGDKYTPLCSPAANMYSTMIWEPNELDHESRLINYYNLVCKKANNSNCDNVSTTYYPARTVKTQITSSDNVHIYDGLNGVSSTVANQTDSPKFLQNSITYTDSMKDTGGEYTFMKLAPHSVTKIRVYVYLEGQDVDNYDLVTNDLNIIVNFGFTKERTYTDELVEDNYFDRIDRFSITDRNGISFLYNTIKNQSLGLSDTINFNVSSQYAEANYDDDDYFANQAGVYQLSENPNVYFYRGSVTNNNVIMGNVCFKILRTDYDIYDGWPNARVRLYYSGLSSNGTSCDNVTYPYFTTTFGNVTNGTGDINLNSSKYYYTDDSNNTVYSNFLINLSSYSSTLATQMSSSSVRILNSNYCNNNQVIGYNPNTFKSETMAQYYYASSERSSALSYSVSPTLECPTEDKYLLQAGLITSDELILAGMTSLFDTNGNNKAAAKYTNSTSFLNYSSTYQAMTASPFIYKTITTSLPSMISWNTSTGALSEVNVNATASYRPVVSIYASTKVTGGDGTLTNPYTLDRYVS